MYKTLPKNGLTPPPPTTRNGGVIRARSVAAGCWLLAVGTSLALPWHFRDIYVCWTKKYKIQFQEKKSFMFFFLSEIYKREDPTLFLSTTAKVKTWYCLTWSFVFFCYQTFYPKPCIICLRDNWSNQKKTALKSSPSGLQKFYEGWITVLLKFSGHLLKVSKVFWKVLRHFWDMSLR